MVDKVYRSIVSNIPYYIMYTFSFVGLLILLYFIDARSDTDVNILEAQGILAVIIALSLAFGFLCLVTLLGYALVKIPLQFWISSNFETKLPRLLFKISVYEDRIIDQQNQVNKLVNITNLINVEPEIDLYKRMMLQNIKEFTTDMQEYDFALRSGSFLDMDTKMHDKYIKPGEEASYSKLVQLNVNLKNQMTILRRMYSYKQEKIKEAIIATDIIAQRGKITQYEQPIQCPFFKPRSADNFIDRQVLKFQYFWYVKDYR